MGGRAAVGREAVDASPCAPEKVVSRDLAAGLRGDLFHVADGEGFPRLPPPNGDAIHTDKPSELLAGNLLAFKEL